MKRLNFLYLLVFFSGCNGATTVDTFENSKLLISYPTGWDIIKEDDLRDKGYYLELEKLSVPGTKLIVGFIEDVELDALLSSVQVGLESKMSYANSNLTFKLATDWNISEEENILQAFYFDQLGESFHGLIYCYKNNGKSIVIIKQEAFEDRNINAPDFDLMEKSLIIF